MSQTESQTLGSPEALIGRNEKRRNQRFACRLPVELKIPGNNYPVQGSTTDVSLGGCYISSVFPIARGTELTLKLWVDGASVVTKATVRTSDPGVGNGMQFVGLDQPGEQVLLNYFATLDAKLPEEAAEPNLLSQLIF